LMKKGNPDGILGRQRPVFYRPKDERHSAD
jgi:hypothetical protein